VAVHPSHVVSRVRAVGNAAPASVIPSTVELCGRCADGKAAILPDGRVAVCEIGRFLATGSVKGGSLAAVLSSAEWAGLAGRVPRGPRRIEVCDPDCSPNDDTCDPGKGGTCPPAGG
jgi:hypothetical protein